MNRTDDSGSAAERLSSILEQQQHAAGEESALLDIVRRYDRLLRDFPDHALAYHNRSAVLQQLGLYQLALDDAERALALRSDLPLLWCSKAFILNMLGRYREGWALYEWRWRGVAGFEQPDWPLQRWQGGDTAGRLLIYAEQGLGDNLQFVRYAWTARERGLDIVVVNHYATESLINDNLRRAGIPAAANGSELSGLGSYVPMMSLPYLFATDTGNIPLSAGYLSAPAYARERWRHVLHRTGQPHIGLVWTGSAKHHRNTERSLTLADLAPLLTQNARFHCLQQQVDERDLAVAQAFPNLSFHHECLHDFSDTAALAEQMDLVISVDTSVAHLAGALGKAVWILLPFHPDWRWQAEGIRTPWYDSARLLRQSRPGDWHGLLQHTAERLQQGLSTGFDRL